MNNYKTISIIGEDSTSVKMFILELAWVLSNEHEVFCHIKDDKIYKRFSQKDINSTSLGNLTLINNYNELLVQENNIDYLVNDEYTDCTDITIFVLNQSTFSVDIINSYSENDLSSEKLLVFLDFIDCEFDDEYFKKYHMNKFFLDSIRAEFYIRFDEKVSIIQTENQLNRIISLKKYPKSRKINLFSIVEYLDKGQAIKYREFFKKLDERISIC